MVDERAPDPLIGRSIAGKFAVESLIGRGAMGAVYKARQIALDKFVAIKVMRDDAAKGLAYAARFQREARAASRLDHPNSIQVIDYGEEPDGLLYIAMEYLDGVDLFGTLSKDWPLSDARIVDILSQVLAALAVAHDMGVVHRDLKPENIMMLSRVDDEGRPRDIVKVCDFGIAKILDVEPQRSSGGRRENDERRALTTTGLLVGTPEYMSPEQCRGEALDARADVYSVGVILYQLLTGRVPFEAPTPIDVVVKHIAEEPTPPSGIDERVSAKLEAVCLRAMRKKRDERYASAREMRAELRATLDEAPGPLEAAPRATPTQVAAASAETLPAPGSMKSTRAPESPESAKRGGALGRALKAVAGVALVATSVIAASAMRERWPSSESARASEPATPNALVTKSPPADPLTSAPAPDRPIVPNVPSSTPARVSTERAAPRAVLAMSSAAPVQPPSPSTSVLPVGVAVAAADPVAAPTPSSTGAHADPAPPSPAPPPPIAAFDPGKGRVVWSVSGAGGGASTGNVARALGHADGAWQSCYQRGLRSRGARVEGSATLRLTCDGEGRVIGAAVTGIDMVDVAGCVRAAAMGTTIPNADTGEAWATIALSFKAPP
jgi:eukaryotic-like serine/threonine-protein kinase